MASLGAARLFYVDLLGCKVGRSSEHRMDINFFGHHVVAHLTPAQANAPSAEFHSDGEDVSVRHFGAIVGQTEWQRLAEHLTQADTPFSMTPRVIRAGTIEEQRIMMMPDGCGNIVELKSLPKDRVFAKSDD